MRKRNIVSLSFFVLGLCCWSLCIVINGSFILLPCGWFFILLSPALLLTSIFLAVVEKNKFFKKFKMSELSVMSSSFFIIGLCCYSLYAIIGSYVDEQGILHEPFILLPSGGLFILLSLVLLFTSIFLAVVKKSKFFARRYGCINQKP